MAQLIEYLIFIMQMLHKYEILTLQIAALENLIEAFRIIIKLRIPKPRTFLLYIFFSGSFIYNELTTKIIKIINSSVGLERISFPPPPSLRNASLLLFPGFLFFKKSL